MPAESWARRAGGPEALPGAHDLGVWEPYVRRVAESGAIRHRSRWLNAVSAQLSAERSQMAGQVANLESARQSLARTGGELAVVRRRMSRARSNAECPNGRVVGTREDVEDVLEELGVSRCGSADFDRREGTSFLASFLFNFQAGNFDAL